jgi:hypothetical protein
VRGDSSVFGHTLPLDLFVRQLKWGGLLLASPLRTALEIRNSLAIGWFLLFGLSGWLFRVGDNLCDAPYGQNEPHRLRKFDESVRLIKPDRAFVDCIDHNH